MRPLRLEFQGLYSYREKTIIDFETLTQGGLFGIFGPVGSGKSTILEAVTFVLYGQTDRMNQQDQRSYNMMNLQSDSLSIDFQFIIRGRTYRFTLSARRNKNNFDDIRTSERAAYRWEGDTWLPLDAAAGGTAEAVLGLSYENFRRTIIIPQGKFQEFLQLGKTNRTEMLEQLFGLERFNLQNRVSSLSRENQDEQNRLAGRFEPLIAVTPRALAEEEEKLANLKEQQESLKSKIEELQKAKAEGLRRQDLFNQLTSEEALLSRALTELEAAAEKEAWLAAVETAQRDFAAPLARLEEIQRETALRGNQAEEARAGLAAAEKKTARAGKRLEEVLEKWEKREEIRTRMEGLKKAALWKAREEEESRLLARKEDLLAHREKLRLGEEELVCERDSLVSRLSREKSGLLATSQRIEIQRWLDRESRLEEDHRRAESSLKENQRACESILVRQIAVIEESFLAEELAGGLNPEILENLKTRFRLEGSAQTDREAAVRLASGLIPGEPCPVCGSREHPAAVSLPEEESAWVDREAELTELQRIEAAFISLKARTAGLKEREEELQGEVRALKEARENQRQTFLWKEHTPGTVQACKDFLNAQEVLERELSVLEEELGQNDGKRDAARREKEEAALTAAETDRELAAVTAVRKSLREEIPRQILTEAETLSSREAGLEGEKAALLLEQLESDRDRLSREREESLLEEESLKTALLHRQREFEESEQKQTQAQGELRQILEKSSFSTLDEVRSCLSAKISLEEEKKRMEDLKSAAAHAARRVEELKQKTREAPYDGGEHDRVTAGLTEALETSAVLMGAAGGMASGIEALRQNLAEKEVLQEKIRRCQKREDNLSVMARLFKARGFVNYVSTLYLRELVDKANERFEILCGKSMRLELTDDNSFAVRDFLNDGRLRSVKTLSGGQTFQAAFSLALALADSVNEKTSEGPGMARGEGFFFLDEGFGSLDRESLQIVMEALWTLGREDRIVGVISHVEEMQQEIPSFLLVSRDEEAGSRIFPGWTL